MSIWPLGFLACFTPERLAHCCPHWTLAERLGLMSSGYQSSFLSLMFSVICSSASLQTSKGCERTKWSLGAPPSSLRENIAVPSLFPWVFVYKELQMAQCPPQGSCLTYCSGRSWPDQGRSLHCWPETEKIHGNTPQSTGDCPANKRLLGSEEEEFLLIYLPEIAMLVKELNFYNFLKCDH